MSHKITKPIQKPIKDVSFPKLEEEILAIWKRERTFEDSLERTAKGKRFTFYDGPPFATGLPHYGHLLQGTIKDIIPRFKTMQGYSVERRFGWDCHGLPVEYELEKERGIGSRQEILEMGVDVFNEACRSIVLRHTKDWEQTTTRLGRWIDFKNAYRTMDPAYMESIWWVVKTLWDKKLLYEGRKSMHICPRCATPLSNFEVTLNYRDRQDPSVYVSFPLADDPKVSLLAWTTTPWTLPANVLLAINPKLKYILVEHEGKRYVVAASRADAAFGEGGYQKLESVDPKELIGRSYEPLFPAEGLEGKHYEIVAADAVTDDEGTGVLHVAPAFGEEDLAIGEREEAAFIQPVDISGRVTTGRYEGLSALESNERIVADLGQDGRLLRKETISHSYPHCWRCDTPLLNYATSSWFVAVTKLKAKLESENAHIHWVPEHVRDGRFGKWLEGARDWAISRQRFWGNPVPVWKCPDGHVTVIGSLDELEQRSGVRPKDLHKHFVDEITFPCPECGGEAKRIEDVLDCWFESGSMPYAYGHYPFEETDAEFKQRFPADFIAEALDQTRGWFYTLHVLGVALKGSRAFNNVVTTGLVLAEDGKKMSKSLKNYPEPEQVMDRFGADALRLYMVDSPIVKGENLNFSEQGVAETLRKFTMTLWNCYSFFATYAAVDGWAPAGPPAKPAASLDRWILARLHELITKDVTPALERYDLMGASRSLAGFLDDLSNWYVRRSRKRFWKTADDADKAEAYATLHHVLTEFCRLAAPFAPFVTDYIHRALTGQSVHLEAWPKGTAGHAARGPLVGQMNDARTVAQLGLAARKQAGLKVRQPLRAIRVVIHGESSLAKNAELAAMVADELNVKEVSFLSKDSELVTEKAIPDPKVIGPIAGAKAQKVIAAIKRGDYEVAKDGGVTSAGVSLPAEAITRSHEPVGNDVVAATPDVIVALDIALDRPLKDEGLARELIRQVQELRKQSGLEVADRITLTVATEDPDLSRAITDHRELIAGETLATSLELDAADGPHRQDVSIDGKPAVIGLTRT